MSDIKRTRFTDIVDDGGVYNPRVAHLAQITAMSCNARLGVAAQKLTC